MGSPEAEVDSDWAAVAALVLQEIRAVLGADLWCVCVCVCIAVVYCYCEYTSNSAPTQM